MRRKIHLGIYTNRRAPRSTVGSRNDTGKLIQLECAYSCRLILFFIVNRAGGKGKCPHASALNLIIKSTEAKVRAMPDVRY